MPEVLVPTLKVMNSETPLRRDVGLVAYDGEETGGDGQPTPTDVNTPR